MYVEDARIHDTDVSNSQGSIRFHEGTAAQDTCLHDDPLQHSSLFAHVLHDAASQLALPVCANDPQLLAGGSMRTEARQWDDTHNTQTRSERKLMLTRDSLDARRRNLCTPFVRAFSFLQPEV